MLNVSGLGLSGLFIVFMLVVGCVIKSSPLVRISERETLLFFNLTFVSTRYVHMFVCMEVYLVRHSNDKS